MDDIRVGLDTITDVAIGSETHIKTIILGGKEIYDRKSSYVYIILDTSKSEDESENITE